MGYSAVVNLAHHEARPEHLLELSPLAVSGEVLLYPYPSRYCQSDWLLNLDSLQFGHLPLGYSRAKGNCDWAQQHVRFQSKTSNSNTSALDTLMERVGVCCDLAHLMIALSRAANLPARMAGGMDYGVDPALGPPDFMPRLRFLWRMSAGPSAGICLILQAPLFRWALCVLRQAGMQPTLPLPPCMASTLERNRLFISRRHPLRKASLSRPGADHALLNDCR